MAYDAQEFKGPGGVNVAECLRIADLVECSSTFTMNFTHHDCGTPACIYGHIVPADQDEPGWGKGAHALGISLAQAEELFCILSGGVGFNEVTPAHAAACLRKLAATGEVDWLGTKPSPTQSGE